MYNSFGQGNKNKIPSYFGVQVKPILPTNFIGDKILDLNSNGFQSTTTQRIGYSFGGVVRAGITKLIAFETGINFNQRYFDIAMSVPDSGLYMSSRLGFIEYDIPINALMYIRLADKWFMNASLGFVIDFKPTDVQVIEGDGYNFFYHTGVANNKFGIGMNANLGFEFRTENSGIFYLGGSARVPFFPLFGMIADYRYQGFNERIIGEVDGSFLSLDLKYFFPNIANKGIQPIESPID
jgi:hypothetical protein